MESPNWEELDKTTFFSLGISMFFGLRAFLHPAFVVKTHVQTMSHAGPAPSSLEVARKVLRTEGPKGLYKGFWVSSSSLIFRQVYFSIYELGRLKLGPNSALYRRLGPSGGEAVRNMASGAAASVAMQVFTVPIDVVTQRLMVQPTGGVIERPQSVPALVRGIYGEGGVMSFYRGFKLAVLQFAPTSAIYWGCYGLYTPPIKRAAGQLGLSLEGAGLASQGVAGLFAGVTTVILTNPLDVIRTRVQVETGDAGGGRKRLSVAQEIRALAREGALMRGVGARMIAVAPASVMIVMIYELIKRLSKKAPRQQEVAAISSRAAAAPL